jgi:hypothetical protein
MKRLLILLLATGLAGCISAQEREQQAAAAAERCKATTKTHVEQARCTNAEQTRLSSGNRNVDLMHYWQSVKLELADKLDRGEITEVQAEAQLKRLQAQLEAEEQRRREKPWDDMRAAAIASQAQAAAPPQPTNCTAMNMGGGMVTWSCH